MCVPGCMETVHRRLTRRGLLGSSLALGAAVAAGGAVRPAVATTLAVPTGPVEPVDLTHTLSADFPTFGGTPGIEVKPVFQIANGGYNLNVWELNEHTGTHMDAPIHFSDGDQNTVAEIPVSQLVVPLAIVDIKAKAAENPDYEVTPDDIAAWESAHGELPAGACVAMNSGWSDHVATDTFRNADADGVMHFPGFHEEAAAALLERDVSGIAVDTLSLDHGASDDFATHYLWLPANRWGLECVANLDELPASGAILVVGAPKVRGGTGGPTRVMALAPAS